VTDDQGGSEPVPEQRPAQLPTAAVPTAAAPTAAPAVTAVPAAAVPVRVLPPADAQVPYTLRVLGGWAWRFVAVAAALWVLMQIAGTLTFVLVAVFVGAVISALVLPLVNLLNRALPRGLAVAVALVFTIAGVLGILTFITVAFINQVPELSKQVVSGFDSLREWLRTSPFQVDSSQIDQWLQSAQQWLQSNAGDLATRVLGGIGTVGEALAGLALALFATIFFMYDGKGIWSWVVGTMPHRAQTRVRTAGDLGWRTFSAYARGTVFIAASNAVLVGIGLTILRVPLPIPLALLVFFGTFIPYVGAPVAMFVAALIALAANGPWSFVAVIVLITIIGQLEGNVLQPMIMSKQVALHPLVVILSVTIGSVSAGIVGAIVAVPVVSVIWVVIRYLTGRDPDHPRPPPFTADPVERVAGDTW
jgi:predicted PurR-regulated permease PerM